MMNKKNFFFHSSVLPLRELRRVITKNTEQEKKIIMPHHRCAKHSKNQSSERVSEPPSIPVVSKVSQGKQRTTIRVKSNTQTRPPAAKVKQAKVKQERICDEIC